MEAEEHDPLPAALAGVEIANEPATTATSSREAETFHERIGDIAHSQLAPELQMYVEGRAGSTPLCSYVLHYNGLKGAST
jgi:hypothetical protein